MLHGRVRLDPLGSTVLGDQRCPAFILGRLVFRDDRMIRCESIAKLLGLWQVIGPAMRLGAALRLLWFALLTNRTRWVLGKVSVKIVLGFDLR